MTDTPPDPFSPLMAIATVVVGVVCFVGFVVVLAFADGPARQDGGAHALSRSAVGYAGVVALLQAAGDPVQVSRSGVARPDAGLRVITPPPGTKPVEMAGRTLLILPKWDTVPFEEHSGWVRPHGLIEATRIRGVLPDALLSSAPPRTGLRHRGDESVRTLIATDEFKGVLSPRPLMRLQTLDLPGLKPLLLDAEGGTVLGTDEDDLFVLAEPDLLNNLALGTAEGARGAATLLRTLAEGEPIVFDLSPNGFARSRNPLRAVFQPPLLGATLCAGAAALLFGFGAATRFGPIRPAGRAIAPGKATLAANAAALIARARREAMLAGPYAALTQRRVADALGLRRAQNPADLTRALQDAAMRRGAGPLPPLLDAAGAVRDRAGLEAVAQRLFRWKQEMLRADH